MKMRMNQLVIAGVAGLSASAAMANPIVSATYNDLSGAWNGSSFVARAVDTNTLRTSGSVARLVSPIGSADFQPGFVSAANPADIVVTLSSTPTADPDTRDGSGTFVITDADGDTISGNILGQWFNGFGAVFFNGELSNVQFTGTTFNGTSGGLFSSLFGGGVFDGAITQLELQNSNFFTSNFSNVPTQESLQIIPAPGVLGLMGLGGLAIARRRR